MAAHSVTALLEIAHRLSYEKDIDTVHALNFAGWADELTFGDWKALRKAADEDDPADLMRTVIVVLRAQIRTWHEKDMPTTHEEWQAPWTARKLRTGKT